MTSAKVSYVCDILSTGVMDGLDSLIGPVNAPVTDPVIMSALRDHRRFHKYVEVTPDCWIWHGTFYTQNGKNTYGQFWLKGTRTGAHRASYLIHVGPVPEGLEVMHSCDVKECVSPFHLRTGTHQENIAEAFAKFAPDKFSGENGGNARLTWNQVHAIRAAVAAGQSQKSQADIYGVVAVQISNIVRGKRWPESKCPIHGTAEAEAAA
jgi:hypothetical protein